MEKSVEKVWKNEENKYKISESTENYEKKCEKSAKKSVKTVWKNNRISDNPYFRTFFVLFWYF